MRRHPSERHQGVTGSNTKICVHIGFEGGEFTSEEYNDPLCIIVNILVYRAVP